jgi:hypothetical protein
VIRRALAGALLAAAVASAGPVTAQSVGAAPDGAGSEFMRLRDAAQLETAGDLRGAEEIVREVLDANPASLTALLTYERLLNVQGRSAEVLPAADRLLERDPASVVGHQTRLRVHAQLGDVSRVDAAAAAWVRATPSLETPYREAALVWRQLDQVRRAIAILEEGRRRIDRADALALELGDAYAAAGDMPRAAAEWARAVGPDGRGFLLVQRRLQNQPDAGASAIPLLVEQLGGRSQPGRIRAATLFAIDAGLESRAQSLARELAAATRPPEREQLLVELARRADGAGLQRLAAWAYAELLRDVRDPGAGLAIRNRVAELALLTGDTALATATYSDLEAAAAPGSPQRRQAMAVRLQLAARDAALDDVAGQLDAFRSEYPHAPELDAAAALVAERYIDGGDAASAERTLSGVNGPRSALVRARIHIRAGDVERAREQLLIAAPQLQGRDATGTIALAALLSRTSPAGGELVARAVAAGKDERPGIIAGGIEDTRRLRAAERAAVLDFLAGLADDSGLAEDAAALRGEIAAQLPQSHEAAAALLALARRAEQHGESADEARVLLERLIVEHPRSTLAPQARRELQRLQDRSTRP